MIQIVLNRLPHQRHESHHNAPHHSPLDAPRPTIICDVLDDFHRRKVLQREREPHRDAVADLDAPAPSVYREVRCQNYAHGVAERVPAEHGEEDVEDGEGDYDRLENTVEGVFYFLRGCVPQRYDQRNQPLEKQNAHPNKQIPLIPNPSERLQPLFILLDESVNNNPYQPIPDQPIRYQVSFTQQRYTLNTTQRQLHQHKHENNDIIVNPETHRKVLGYENVVGQGDA
mmetsp:Transcript_28235/g.53435  ORF Transcript_28235/g.53435 Transcript_28235/m.53435 type:complete len:228 (+) Transcript_28235:285-968(+)